MHQNIKQNYAKNLDAKLYNAKYYDYMLYTGEKMHINKSDLDKMVIADFSDLNIVSGTLYSTVTWLDAVNNGVEMNDIGFTGIDNGLITFEKDRITNKEFLDIYLDSKYVIESGDTRLFLNPVDGNSQMFSYPMELVKNDGDKYIACKGGFYQGFFKLEGFDYQVLPDRIDDDITLHFELRPRSEYNVGIDTVNYVHPENEGMFFFMGTRAENKFWPFYKTNINKTSKLKKNNAVNEGYFDGCNESGETYNINENNVIDVEWLREEMPEQKEEGYFIIGDGYYAFDGERNVNKSFPKKEMSIIYSPKSISTTFLNTYNFKAEGNCGCPSCNEPIKENTAHCDDCCERYFKDNYFDNKCPDEDNNKAIEEHFIGKDITIDKNGYNDSDGHSTNKNGYYEITTDNQFVMFDRTCDGIKSHEYESGMTVTLQGRKVWPNANYFLLMNRTCTGYTTQTIDQYNEEHAYDYNIYKDIRGNVFGLRITKDGAIGYRYGILDCDNDNPDKYSVLEEYSKNGVIKTDQWNSINVRFAVIHPTDSKCDMKIRKMRIMIYVNGFLVFISKEVDTIIFKPIDEVYQKQEGVPYNISLGGGSLGLIESIVSNYYAISDYILPIERDFCGTFLGDIKSFKIYKGFVDYSSISNYLS